MLTLGEIDQGKDISQDALLSKMQLYLIKRYGHERFQILANRGYCHGFSVLWAAVMWISGSLPKTAKEQDNIQFLQDAFLNIAEYDGRILDDKNPKDKHVIDCFERIINDVILMHQPTCVNPHSNWQDYATSIEILFGEKQNKEIITHKNPKTRTPILNEIDLYHYLESQKDKIINKPILIHVMFHATALCRTKEGKWLYYDPNSKRGAIEVAHSYTLAQLIFKAHRLKPFISYEIECINLFTQEPILNIKNLPLLLKRYLDTSDVKSIRHFFAMVQLLPGATQQLIKNYLLQSEILCSSIGYLNAEILELFLKFGFAANATFMTQMNRNLFYYSDPRCAATLFKRGANINKIDTSGITPVIFAIQNNDLALAKKLLELGAAYDINTLLHYAVNTNSKQMVEFILNYEKSSLLTNEYIKSIHLAAQQGSIEILVLLLTTGFQLNIIQPNRYYLAFILEIAAENANLPVVQAILSQEAPFGTTAFTSRGSESLYKAVQRNHYSIAALLLRYLNADNISQLITEAARNNNARMLTLLLTQKIAIPFKWQTTALPLTIEHGKAEALECLLAHLKPKRETLIQAFPYAHHDCIKILLQYCDRNKIKLLPEILENIIAKIIKQKPPEATLVTELFTRYTAAVKQQPQSYLPGRYKFVLSMYNQAIDLGNQELVKIIGETTKIELESLEQKIAAASTQKAIIYPGELRTDILQAIEKGDKEKVIALFQTFIALPMNWQLKQQRIIGLLRAAATNKQTEIVDFLLENGKFTLEEREAIIKDLLYHATLGNCLDLIELLLSKTEDKQRALTWTYHTQDLTQPTLFHIAVTKCHWSVTELLLKHGANPLAIDNQGCSVIVKALETKNCTTIIKLLTNLIYSGNQWIKTQLAVFTKEHDAALSIIEHYLTQENAQLYYRLKIAEHTNKINLLDSLLNKLGEISQQTTNAFAPTQKIFILFLINSIAKAKTADIINILKNAAAITPEDEKRMTGIFAKYPSLPTYLANKYSQWQTTSATSTLVHAI